MRLPDYQPTTVPTGEYVAEIASEISEKTSQFDPDKSYFELKLTLQNSRGEYFDFLWRFNAKTRVYKDLLLLLDGKEQESGIVTAPESYRGRRFKLSLIERPGKQDSNRMVNEITSVSRVEETEVKPKATTEFTPEADPDSDEVPFG
jgi:hypothetical protein